MNSIFFLFWHCKGKLWHKNIIVIFIGNQNFIKYICVPLLRTTVLTYIYMQGIQYLLRKMTITEYWKCIAWSHWKWQYNQNSNHKIVIKLFFRPFLLGWVRWKMISIDWFSLVSDFSSHYIHGIEKWIMLRQNATISIYSSSHFKRML